MLLMFQKEGTVVAFALIPLIARQGKVNRWHFAHASRKVRDIEQYCQYSFFVSVRAMANKLAYHVGLHGRGIRTTLWHQILYHFASLPLVLLRWTTYRKNACLKRLFAESVEMERRNGEEIIDEDIAQLPPP